MELKKLVTVTRTDIPEGYQAVQSTHAALDFVFEHPTRAGPWHKESNTLVMLTVADEYQLKRLIRKCEYLGLAYTAFREPDIGNVITAICIEPHEETYKIVSKLPLLLPKTINNDTVKDNGNEMPSSKSHQEDIIQEETDRNPRSGEDSIIQRDLQPEQSNALGIEFL